MKYIKKDFKQYAINQSYCHCVAANFTTKPFCVCNSLLKNAVKIYIVQRNMHYSYYTDKHVDKHGLLQRKWANIMIKWMLQHELSTRNMCSICNYTVMRHGGNPRSIFISKFTYKCKKVQRLDIYQNTYIDYIGVKIRLLTVCSRAGNAFKGTQTGFMKSKCKNPN